LQFVNITAVVAGNGVNLNQVERVIRDYFAELALLIYTKQLF
jgi:predicted amino acid-binding ACT domain protein